MLPAKEIDILTHDVLAFTVCHIIIIEEELVPARGFRRVIG